jgi:hypothetical protein
MSIARMLGALAIAGVVGAGALVPTNAEARNGRAAAGFIGGFAAGAMLGAAVGGPYWGPYPYGYYPAPVFYPPVPYYGPYYGACFRRTVWNGRRWRRVVVCD